MSRTTIIALMLLHDYLRRGITPLSNSKCRGGSAHRGGYQLKFSRIVTGHWQTQMAWQGTLKEEQQDVGTSGRRLMRGVQEDHEGIH